MKFFGAWWRGPRTNQLDFCGDPDPGYAEIFYCPAWLLSLSVDDISSFICKFCNFFTLHYILSCIAVTQF